MKEKEEAVPTKPKNSEIPTRARDFKAEMRAEMMKRRTIPGYEGKNIFSVSEEDLEALKQYDEVKERMRAEMRRRVNKILENRTDGDFIDEALHPSNTQRMSIQEIGRILGVS